MRVEDVVLHHRDGPARLFQGQGRGAPGQRPVLFSSINVDIVSPAHTVLLVVELAERPKIP